MLQRGQCVGSTTTGGDSDDNIFLAGFAAGDVFLAQIERVFLVFYCRMQRFVAAGDDVLNEFGADAESGRNFGGVERAQATTGSGSGVNQAAAFAERVGHEIDGFCDLGQLLFNGLRYALVFAVNRVSDLEGTHGVEVQRAGILLLGCELREVDFEFPRLHRLAPDSIASTTAS